MKKIIMLGEQMQKITETKVQKYGLRGVAITLPVIYRNDNRIQIGDKLNIYRDSIQGKDVLVIIPQSKEQSVSSTPVSN